MRRRRGPLLLNVLTVALLALSAAGATVVAFFFVQPSNPLNPYPPPTLPALAVLPTQSNLPTAEIAVATVTPLFSATPTPTTTASATASPSPAATPTPSASPTRTPPPASLTPTTTGEPGATSRPAGSFPFVVQEGFPHALGNFANDQGCRWLGVAGIVLDQSGNGLNDYVVRLEGGGLTLDAVSGSAPAYSATGGGFEFALNDHVIATQAEYSLQLYNSSGQPVSVKMFFDTYADCDRNLILINFQRVP